MHARTHAHAQNSFNLSSMSFCCICCPYHRRRQSEAIIHLTNDHVIRPIPVRSLSISYDLPHYDTETPDVRSRRKLPVGNGLRSRPSDWDLATLNRNTADSVYITKLLQDFTEPVLYTLRICTHYHNDVSWCYLCSVRSINVVFCLHFSGQTKVSNFTDEILIYQDVSGCQILQGNDLVTC